MRIRACLMVVFAGCVPMQPTTSTSTGQVQVTCPMVVDCYSRCTNDACIAWCEGGVDPAVVSLSRAFTMCSLQNQCRDSTCQQTRCGNELAACVGSGPQVATNQQQQLQQPMAPNSPPQPAGRVHTRLLMGMRQTGAGSSYTAGIGWYVLFDDGRVLARLPTAGLEGVDENALAGDLGTYTVQGGTMEMWFQQYHPVFQLRDDGSWTGAEGTFWPADSLDGAVIDGAYAPRSGPPEIAFTTDGRFQTNGGLLIDNPGYGLTPTPAGQGTYRIAQNTLTLSYTTGQVIRISISTLKSRELPRASSLFFGGFEYHRS